MILTLQTDISIKPIVSVHGDMIRCDMGVLLLEFDKEGFNDFVYEVISQSIKYGVDLNIKK